MIAFVLNFVREIVQGPLYGNFEDDWKNILICGLTSKADMLMLLILLIGFTLVYKNVFCIILMSAIVAELWHTARGDRTYVDLMPMLACVDVGILPVIQFAVLLSLIFLVSKKYIDERNLKMLNLDSSGCIF